VGVVYWFLVFWLEFSTKNNNTYIVYSTHYTSFFYVLIYLMDTHINFLKAGDKKHHFDEHDLPTLIHYKAKEWWSHYSMTLIANLVLQWAKVLMLTWYSEAKEQFYRNTQAITEKTVVVHNLAEVKKNKNKQVIIIHDDDETLCLATIKELPDIHERIIFIKNIDLFHKNLLTTCLKYNKIILSGDLDACAAKANISKKK